MKKAGRPVRSTVTKQKQSLYFPEDMLEEIAAQADRLDRSLSWVVQRAWRLARDTVRGAQSLKPPPVPNVEND